MPLSISRLYQAMEGNQHPCFQKKFPVAAKCRFFDISAWLASGRVVAGKGTLSKHCSDSVLRAGSLPARAETARAAGSSGSRLRPLCGGGRVEPVSPTPPVSLREAQLPKCAPPALAGTLETTRPYARAATPRRSFNSLPSTTGGTTVHAI